MKVVIRGYWANYVGTDYCEALGTYYSLTDPECLADAADRAWANYEEPDEDDGIEDEGPEYWVEEYNPDIHDGLKAGGMPFADWEFE